jgi:D-alanyl-lipoteichoic acid acyltransferase DltB (MBOAT superfamily)
MSFNSCAFLIFFPLVYLFYLLLRKNLKAQNFLLLLASYVFYGYWDWRFLSLIAFTTLINYVSALRVDRDDKTPGRRWNFLLAVALNLSVLGVFKYFNFFAENFALVLQGLGIKASPITLKVALPVGISFFTFQALGYLIDVYQKKERACQSLIEFAVYVAFFPQLVAGPIERARRLLPQISSTRRIAPDQVNLGIFLIIWGYFKKVVVADNLALIVDQVFGNHLSYYGLDLVLAAIAFNFQIYCDFSGYSDIARGLGKLMGIELMVNFRLPYLALNPQDFWRRWHISLSTWLRDYLYIPLGGNKKGDLKTYRNLGLTFLLGGLWHGAAWNFVIWGVYHWALIAIHRLVRVFGPDRRDSSRARILLKITVMFVLSILGWVIFRSNSFDQVFYMLGHMGLEWSQHTGPFAKRLIFFLIPLVVIELWQYMAGNLAAPAGGGILRRSFVYGLLLAGILAYGVRESVEFIYFQF